MVSAGRRVPSLAYRCACGSWLCSATVFSHAGLTGPKRAKTSHASAGRLFRAPAGTAVRWEGQPLTMTNLIDLVGKVVIVTGASCGIGASTARLLHADGACPVLAARRADRLDALSKESDGALAVPADVTDPAQVRDLVDVPFALQFADRELYARALAACGPAYEAIQDTGEAEFLRAAAGWAREELRDGLPLRAGINVVGYLARQPEGAQRA